MEKIKLFFDKYKNVIDNISKINFYDENVRHILYVVIPAFVHKYGLSKEKIIIDCLKSTLFIVSNEKNNNEEAFFDRKLIKSYDSFYFQKYIVINGLVKSQYIDLIDAIVHEFNHALNSMNNDMVVINNSIKLRTGLCYILYNDNLPKKDNSYILEEIINTKQSEDIISIIYNSYYDGENDEIKNLLNVISNEKNGSKYKSNAYSIFMDCCRKLLENKTFINTVELYRLNGEIDYIEKWYDDICGNSGEYQKMINELLKLESLLKKYEKTFLKRRIEIKIINTIKEIDNMLNRFVSSTVYK